jgi:hypothetical protein
MRLYDVPTDMAIVGTEPAVLQERDRALQVLLRPGEQMWIVDERYDPVENIWHTDIVRSVPHGVWMRRRYMYDVQKRILYFNGERPLREGEMATLRRGATVLRKETIEKK